MDVTATHRAEIAPASLSEDWKRSCPGEKPEQHADSSACPCPRWGKCVGSALGSRLSPGQRCSRGLTCKASPPGGSLLLPTSHLQLGFLFPLPGVSQSSVGHHTQVCSWRANAGPTYNLQAPLQLQGLHAQKQPQQVARRTWLGPHRRCERCYAPQRRSLTRFLWQVCVLGSFMC